MKRLTGRRNGRAYIVGCPDFALPKIAGLIIQQVVDRLAAIEDILGDEYDLDRLSVMVNQCMTMREEVAERFSLTAKIPLDRLREPVEADREGRCVAQKFAPGDEVWIVERDEDGDASEVSGFVFVVSVNGVAIVSPSIDDCNDIDFILSDFVKETAAEFSGSLSGYPIFDCYKSRDEAKAALKAREQDEQQLL